VERMVQERLEKMRKAKEPAFTKPAGDEVPKNWQEKNNGFVMDVSMTSKQSNFK